LVGVDSISLYREALHDEQSHVYRAQRNGLKRLHTCCALLSLAILCTTDYPLCCTCRYYCRPSTLPIFRSALSGDVLHPAILCALLIVWRFYLQPTISALLYLAIFQPAIRRSTLPVDIPTDYPLCRLSALLSLALLPLTIQSTDYPLCCLWRYSNRLCCVLNSIQQYYNRLSSLLCLSILQPTLRRSTLPVDITTDYPICSLWRTLTDYPIYRLCALLSLALLQPTMMCALLCSTLSSDATTNSPLSFAWRYSNRLSAALLCLSILQLTICSTDYPLCSLWRYSNRLSTVHFSVWRYHNRVSALLCLSILVQPTIHALLCLLILQSTIRSTLPVDITTGYPLYSLSGVTPIYHLM
jgi:hypothetical protein